MIIHRIVIIDSSVPIPCPFGGNGRCVMYITIEKAVNLLKRVKAPTNFSNNTDFGHHRHQQNAFYALGINTNQQQQNAKNKPMQHHQIAPLRIAVASAVASLTREATAAA